MLKDLSYVASIIMGVGVLGGGILLALKFSFRLGLVLENVERLDARVERIEEWIFSQNE